MYLKLFLFVVSLILVFAHVRYTGFAAKEKRDGCIRVWRGWNWWSSDTPYSGRPEIPVYDVIRESF
jgi:hypothetical protein